MKYRVDQQLSEWCLGFDIRLPLEQRVSIGAYCGVDPVCWPRPSAYEIELRDLAWKGSNSFLWDEIPPRSLLDKCKEFDIIAITLISHLSKDQLLSLANDGRSYLYLDKFIHERQFPLTRLGYDVADAFISSPMCKGSEIKRENSNLFGLFETYEEALQASMTNTSVCLFPEAASFVMSVFVLESKEI